MLSGMNWRTTSALAKKKSENWKRKEKMINFKNIRLNGLNEKEVLELREKYGGSLFQFLSQKPKQTY